MNEQWVSFLSVYLMPLSDVWSFSCSGLIEKMYSWLQKEEKPMPQVVRFMVSKQPHPTVVIVSNLGEKWEKAKHTRRARLEGHASCTENSRLQTQRSLKGWIFGLFGMSRAHQNQISRVACISPALLFRRNYTLLTAYTVRCIKPRFPHFFFRGLVFHLLPTKFSGGGGGGIKTFL